MLDFPLPVRSEIIISQTVVLRIYHTLQTGLQFGPLGKIDLNLEYRVLNSLTEVPASLGHRAQAARPVPFGLTSPPGMA
jgi:hypothetical protein